MLRISINGFGRIGRNILRYLTEFPNPEIQCVAIYDLYDISTLAHLFRYDSILGSFKGNVQHNENTLFINNQKIKIFKGNRNNPSFQWKELGIDVVIDSTGQCRNRKLAEKHLEYGAKKVIITAPAEGVDFNLLMGLNHQNYNSNKHHIISNLSCTTNCLAPILWVLDKEFVFKQGFMNTVHAYTNDQEILDHSHKDLRRSRAAALSMIPTTTGATEAIFKVFPHFKGKLKGSSIRVPVPNVSLIDLVFECEKAMDVESLNQVFQNYSENYLKSILAYSNEPLVSIDIRKNPHSAIIDALSTQIIESKNNDKGHLGRVLAWYDNEWAYSIRIIDFIKWISSK